MDKPLNVLEKLTLPLVSQIQCFLFGVQLLSSYDCRKWVIFTKKRILQWKILNSGKMGVGLKIKPKYQKAHPYAKFGRINRFAYVSAMF